MSRRPFTLYSLILLISLVIAGCASTSGGEVAVVTERPEAPVALPDTAESIPVEPTVSPYDTVQAERFDRGKMWTFDHPPLDYFAEAYDFRPDSAWFERARLGALRFSTYCSASFVSPNGLVLTNHHCGRESVSEVSESDEGLLDAGFYASSLIDERKVEELYVEQLIAIEDVSERVFQAGQEVRGDDQQADARQRMVEQIEEEMTEAARERDTTLTVQVIELYNGGEYAAYTFRRYEDVRLVMAPEFELGFFGGDPDNFTYPRYALDMSFFRVYGPDGRPVRSEHYFPWSREGADEGDLVFVVGNPGSTSRLSTVSQLEFERDVNLPIQIVAIERRAEVLKEYIAAHPEQAEQYDLRNAYLSLSNQIKANTGELGGLRDPYLIARRAAAEREMIEQAPDSLQPELRNILQNIAELQISQRTLAPRVRAFAFFASELGSRVLGRSLYGFYYDFLRQRNALAPDELEEIKEDALDLEDWPKDLEKQFIEIRLQEIQEALGPGDLTMQRVLAGKSVSELATMLVDSSALVDSARYAELLDEGYLNSDDPSVEVISALAPLYFQFVQQVQDFSDREDNLNARLARSRFALYGHDVPPDASFSPRISDGIVKGYPFNGTIAPVYTTFYGLFNHYHAYRGTPFEEDFDLPERWLNASSSFDRSTPLNLVSTNDITGGSSGSPLLNADLEIVGLVFDGNIESLPNNYLYRDDAARTVSVDARGILESLDDIYDADRLVLELTTGQMLPSEAEADAAMSSSR